MHWTTKCCSFYFADIVFDIIQSSAFKLSHYMHYTTFQADFCGNNKKNYSWIWLHQAALAIQPQTQEQK